MIRVGIVGATGYTGAELVRILADHPEVALTVLTSRQYVDERYDRIYPAFSGRIDLTCEAFDHGRISDRTDVVFTALPHQLPMEIVPKLAERGCKVIDLSADFRFSDAQRYADAYQPHTAPEWLAKAVYGLSEVFTDQIRAAMVVGNPGCYPTSILLPLIPLIKAGHIDIGSLVADSKSGVSGAGRGPAVTMLFSEVSESFKAYKVAVHRHNPEIDEVLSQVAGQAVHLTFVPHLVPMTRGMLSTIYATLNAPTDLADLRECLRSFYQDRPFVRLCAPDQLPNTLHVRGTNHCDIGLRIDKDGGRLIVLAAIDNLVKGAAGQAVQNMNLMFNLKETAGLLAMPWPV